MKLWLRKPQPLGERGMYLGAGYAYDSRPAAKPSPQTVCRETSTVDLLRI